MGASVSTQRKLFRPFNAGEFTVAWLTFKGDAVEDEEHRDVARKEGLLSSKLLRGLFGDMTVQCLKNLPGDTVSKEAFICTLALCYEGNTEDRISYLFTMYNITLTGENKNEEGSIAEKDYLLLLNYLEEYMPLPKQLYAAFEECMIPMAGLLSNSRFVTWVRQYPDVMEFLAIHLPPSPTPGSPLSIRTSEEFLPNSDPLNSSPSCRNDPTSSSLGSFDFIGGEDSGDEDSDGLYDSDQLTEMELSQSSFRGSTSSMNGNDELTRILKEAGAVVKDDTLDNSEQGTDRTAPLVSPVAIRDPFYPPEEQGISTYRRGRTGTSRSRGVQKMGRYMGKAVNGGISRVGHVGRSILHVGKSQGNNQHSSGAAADESDPTTADLLSAGHFSSESQSTKKYVCGYLHKISDSKWGKKRSWHRRWFVLDRQRGVLSYYRHNPANHIQMSSSQGNIVHMADSPVPPKRSLPTSSSQPPETRQESSVSPTQPFNSTTEVNGNSSESTDRVSQLSTEARDSESPVRTPTVVDEKPAEPDKQQQEPHQDQPQEQQTLLYLNESHPWYRGALDLNMDNVSLLFEKTLAKNAPTRYFFQVSTLSLHEMDSKRGIQYKLCADTEVDFDLWTSAIAEVVNRKDTKHAIAAGGAPVLTHQQLYRQRLLKQQVEAQKATAQDDVVDTVAESAQNQAKTSPPAPHQKRKPPPRIVTQFPLTSGGGSSSNSFWHLHVHVDGTKQCLIVGFMLNIVAIRCIAGEHVLWKIAVCIAVTCVFVFSVYNPRPSQRGGLGICENPNSRTFTGGNVDAALLATDIADCCDPTNCCLHKVKESSYHGGEAVNGTEGSSGGPRRKFSDSRRIVKFPMGSTMARSDMQENGKSSNVEHSWSTSRAESFLVRSSEYKKLRRKEASQPALFEFLGADLVRTDSKVDLISQRVEFPPELQDAKLFIINAQLPSYGPSVWGDGTCDGAGYSLALYWKIPDDVFEELKSPTSTTLCLLKRFLEAGDDRSLTDRFKVIAQVTNTDECGLTGMAKKLLVGHNATPVLTRPQHRIYHFGDGSTEVVVDVHAFSYIARRGIHLLIDKTAKLVIDVAFVIQGETEDELPEQVLGCCRLDHASVQKAAELP